MMKGIYPCAKDNSDFALHTIHIALAHPCMSCRLLAHPGRHTHASGRLLSGEDRSRPPLVGAAVHDPERHFATVNYRTAKGLFDHLVSAAEQGERKCNAKRFGSFKI